MTTIDERMEELKRDLVEAARLLRSADNVMRRAGNPSLQQTRTYIRSFLKKRPHLPQPPNFVWRKQMLLTGVQMKDAIRLLQTALGGISGELRLQIRQFLESVRPELLAEVGLADTVSESSDFRSLYSRAAAHLFELLRNGPSESVTRMNALNFLRKHSPELASRIQSSEGTTGATELAKLEKRLDGLEQLFQTSEQLRKAIILIRKVAPFINNGGLVIEVHKFLDTLSEDIDSDPRRAEGIHGDVGQCAGCDVSGHQDDPGKPGVQGEPGFIKPAAKSLYRIDLRGAVLIFTPFPNPNQWEAVTLTAGNGDLRYIGDGDGLAIQAQFMATSIAPAAGMRQLEAGQGHLSVLFIEPSGTKEMDRCEFNHLVSDWRIDNNSFVTLLAIGGSPEPKVSRPTPEVIKQLTGK